jgi:sugar lactone lactonase YvrE
MVRLTRAAMVLLACLVWAGPAEASEFVYVSNHDPYGGTVSQFAIGPFGDLAPLVPAAVPSGYDPGAIAIDRNGRNAYVASTDGIDRYAIGRHGTLTRKEQTNVEQFEPSDLAITPDGERLYASCSPRRTPCRCPGTARAKTCPRDGTRASSVG